MIHRAAVLALFLGTVCAGEIRNPFAHVHQTRERIFSSVARINAAKGSVSAASLLQKADTTEITNPLLNKHAQKAVETAQKSQNGAPKAVPMQQSPCADIQEIQDVLQESGCFDIFNPDLNFTSFPEAAATACGTCDLNTAQGIIDDWDESCADNNFGGSGIDELIPMLYAICSEEPAGTYCATPIGAVVLFGLDEDYNADYIEAACEESTCTDTFVENWATNRVEDVECYPGALGLNLICLQDGGDYCASSFEGLFGDFGEFTSSATELQGFCDGSCGQLFLDSYFTQYEENADCYDETAFNMAEVFCQQQDGDTFCLTAINAYFEDTATMDPECPLDQQPSEWADIDCTAECAAEMLTLSNTLECCANVLPLLAFGSQDEGDAAVAWVNNDCADVTFGDECTSAYTPQSTTSAASPHRTPPTALILVLSVATSLIVLFA